MKKLFRTRKNRVIALVLAAALLVGSFATGLAVTLAETKWQYRLQQQNTLNVLPAGAPFTLAASGLALARLVDEDLGKFNKVGTNYSLAYGEKTAGIAQVVRVNNSGLFMLDLNIQIVDEDNITGYDLPNEGNGYVSKVSADPINLGIKYYKSPAAVVPTGSSWAPNESTINNHETSTSISNALAQQVKWESLDPEILQVAADKRTVYARAEGITMLLGTFTDRWGVEQHIHFVFGVGTAPGKSNNALSKLLDAIQKGQTILDLDPNPYKEEGLGVLQQAVKDANDMLDDGNLNEAALQGAITAIENAIAGLEPAATGGEVIITVPGGGKYKRPSGPPHVYEILDPETGESLEPPQYIYDPSDGLAQDPPELGDNTLPAYKDDYIYYAEAEPQGSNIFYKIDPNTGELDTDNPIWGGADKRPGGGNDSKAYYDEDSDTWYAEDPAGSNLWKPVLTAESNGANQGNVNATKNTWRGGGEDGKPGTLDDLFPITVVDGITVAGGPTWATGDDLYYIGMGDDGRFDTSGHNGSGRPKNDVVLDSDVKYRLVDGKLVPDDIVDPEDSGYKYVYVETDPELGNIYEKVTNPGGSSLNPAEYYIYEDGEWVRVWPKVPGPGWTKTKPATGTAPQITSAASATVTGGSLSTFQVTATGTAPIAYGLSGAPAGVTINSSSGLMSIADSVVASTYTFTVTASNGTLPNASQGFTLVVDSAVEYVDMSSVTLTGTSIVSGGTNKIPLIAQTSVTYGDGDPLNEQFTTEAYDPDVHGPAIYEVTTTGLHANTKIYEQGAVTVYLGINNDDVGKSITVQVSIGGQSNTASFMLLPIPETTVATVGSGRTVTDNSGTWVEIAISGDYSLILRTEFISQGKFNTYTTEGSQHYDGSNAQTKINQWYASVAESDLIKLHAVENDAMTKIGAYNIGIGKAGISAPIANRPEPGEKNVAFLLSYQEGAKFCCTGYWPGTGYVTHPRDQRYENWQKLASHSVEWWLRTPLNAGDVCYFGSDGDIRYGDNNWVTKSWGFRPALWVVNTDIPWIN